MGNRLVKLWQILPTFVAGASLGALVTWLSTRARRNAPVEQETPGEPEPRAPGLGQALGGAAAQTLRGARERRGRGEETPLDLERMRAEVAAIPGCDQVHLRDLGGGIVEVLGAAPDPNTVNLVLTSLRDEPGVSVVVNRIWTPASAGERKPDLSPIPRVRRDTSVN
jgi:hypothetical protein